MRKLLKYDLKALFPIWGISTAVIVVFYFLGIFAMRGIVDMFNTPDSYEPPFAQIIYQLGSIGAFFLIVIGFVAYPILNYVFILKRFYTHFYTDQGYLTFTLPVKRTQLMGSKLLSALICMMSSFLLMLGGILVIALFGSDPQALVNREVLTFLSNMFTELWLRVGGWLPVYVVEVLLLLILFFTVDILFVYTCITLGAVWSKRYKILVAFLIYYLSGMVLSPLMQFLSVFIFGSSPFYRLEYMDTPSVCVFAGALMLLIVAVMATVAWLLYYLNVRLLHKKLNLA